MRTNDAISHSCLHRCGNFRGIWGRKFSHAMRVGTGHRAGACKGGEPGGSLRAAGSSAGDLLTLPDLAGSDSRASRAQGR